jgi:hypothetical protein
MAFDETLKIRGGTEFPGQGEELPGRGRSPALIHGGRPRVEWDGFFELISFRDVDGHVHDRIEAHPLRFPELGRQPDDRVVLEPGEMPVDVLDVARDLPFAILPVPGQAEDDGQELDPRINRYRNRRSLLSQNGSRWDENEAGDHAQKKQKAKLCFHSRSPFLVAPGKPLEPLPVEAALDHRLWRI